MLLQFSSNTQWAVSCVRPVVQNNCRFSIKENESFACAFRFARITSVGWWWSVLKCSSLWFVQSNVVHQLKHYLRLWHFKMPLCANSHHVSKQKPFWPAPEHSWFYWKQDASRKFWTIIPCFKTNGNGWFFLPPFCPAGQWPAHFWLGKCREIQSSVADCGNLG